MSAKNKYIAIGLVIALCIVIGIVFVVNADNIADAFKPDPHIVLDKSASGEKRTIMTFDIGSGLTESITVKADAKVYSGAQLPQSRETGSGNYWVMMTEDEAQDEFYDSLVRQFNDIQLRHRFTSDQYVEMVTSFVQTIPYDTVAAVVPQYPVVTAIDKMGDCDETSMLLAGILSHAGYDVALLDFDAVNHMTAGIKTTDGIGYINGYTAIETTQEGWYVSQTDQLSKADVYPIGEGTKTYGSSSQVSSIVNYFNTLDMKWDSIERGVDTTLNRANNLYAQYEQLSNERENVNTQMVELNHQYETTDMPYDTYESQWTSLENRYYTLTQQMNSLWDQYETQYNSYSNTVNSRNDWADIYNTLADAKVCDRAEMYELIKAHPL